MINNRKIKINIFYHDMYNNSNAYLLSLEQNNNMELTLLDFGP